MITYEEIETFVDAGQTAQEIADYLNASKVTVKPIALDQLIYVMNERGMLRDLGDGSWGGSVWTLVVAVRANAPAESVDAVNRWFAHITNTRNTSFDTTKIEFAAPLQAIRAAFADQQGMPESDDFDAMIALGGGYRYENVAAADVQAAIDKKTATELKSEYDEKYNEYVSPNFGDRAALVAGIKSLAAAIEGT